MNPAHEFVGRFIGIPEMNVLEGTVEKGIFRAEGDVTAPVSESLSGPVHLGVRPKDVHLKGELPTDQESEPIQVRTDIVELLGARAIISFEAKGRKLKALLEARELEGLREGASAQVVFDLSRLHFFDSDTGERIDETESQ